MCLTGAHETDYPVGEELSADGEASKVSCAAANSSTGFDGGLEGITVVDCSAEGAVAIPQTVCTNSIESSDTGNTITAKNIINACFIYSIFLHRNFPFNILKHCFLAIARVLEK